MKFDKIMNICYRIICVITGIVVVLGLCVSCFKSPLKACAFSPADPTAWASLVDDWRDDYENNLVSTLQQINQGLADGDINASTDAGKRYLAVQALQTLALYNTSMGVTLHAVDLALQTVPDFSAIDSLPDSFSVSGSGASGVFYDNNHVLHFGTALQSSSMSGTLFTSDLFTITYGFYSNQTDLLDSTLYSCSPYSYTSGVTNYLGVQCNKIGGGSFYPYRRTFANSSYLTIQSASFYNGSVSSANVSVPRYLDNSYPPTILPTTNVCGICSGSVYPGTSGYTNLLGYSSAVFLPENSVDTQTPWNYYNNTILPYIQQNFPEITNNYLVFPEGWYPAPTPDPTEPPTFPNGGIYIDKQYNIGVNIIFPTDASGQPITDASGETVTETEYITDTSPLDGEYSFQMPTLAKLNMYDASLPNPDISAFSDGISWIWNACYNILTDSGFMPVVMIVFALALFGFILWKLGG